MKFIFATNNQNKVEEVLQQCNGQIQIESLSQAGINEDIPETSETIEGNAIQKAQYLWDKYGVNCFADDTGLCIASLNGEPGVLSARYAGPDKNALNNMALVLEKMNGKKNRSAYFQTTIALIESGELKIFTGIAEGEITEKLSGNEGFGYDPIFRPIGESRTFAELTIEEKNSISHRGKAVMQLIDYLESR